MSRIFLCLLLAGWLMLPARTHAALQSGEAAGAPVAEPPVAEEPAAATESTPPPAPATQPAPAAPAVQTAPAAVAQPQAPRKRILTEAGSREIELDLAVEKDKQHSDDFGDFDSSSTLLSLKFGYCATDQHEIGLLASYLKFSGDGVALKSYTVGPFYTFNVPSPPSNIVPFFSLAAGISRSDSDDGFFSYSEDGRMFEASGGVRIFPGEDFSVNVGFFYRKSEMDLEGFDYTTTSTGLRVGLSGFLR